MSHDGVAKALLRQSVDRPVADLTEPAALQRLLADRFRSGRGERVAVALGCSAGIATAALADSSGRHRDWAAPVGCVAKLLTAELMRRAVAAGHLGFDTTVLELFGAAAAPLRGVRIRHLLEHTHGLDDSLLAGPTHRHGLIDGYELLRRTRPLRRFERPGVVYNYGHLGAWLSAAVLERVHGRTYGSLVRDDLLGSLGIAGAWSCERPLCAATGAGLALTAEQLARFALQTRAMRPYRPAAVTRLPGWNPLEQGISLGWKCAGDGWFGHQSAWPAASSYVRVDPQRHLVLAVLARERSAAAVAAALLGGLFAELFDLCPPAAAAAPPERWAGLYEHAAHAIEIEPAASGLRARVRARDGRGALAPATLAVLQPVGGSVFLAQPPSEILPYAQFVAHSGATTWLWNGRCLLRRIRTCGPPEGVTLTCGKR